MSADKWCLTYQMFGSRKRLSAGCVATKSAAAEAAVALLLSNPNVRDVDVRRQARRGRRGRR